MNNVTIVTPTLDIAKLVYGAVLNDLPDETHAFEAALDAVDDHIPADVYDRLLNVFMATLDTAQENAFRAGWEMRGKL